MTMASRPAIKKKMKAETPYRMPIRLASTVVSQPQTAFQKDGTRAGCARDGVAARAARLSKDDGAAPRFRARGPRGRRLLVAHPVGKVGFRLHEDLHLHVGVRRAAELGTLAGEDVHFAGLEPQII